jgi:hypothetical protein
MTAPRNGSWLLVVSSWPKRSVFSLFTLWSPGVSPNPIRVDPSTEPEGCSLGLTALPVLAKVRVKVLEPHPKCLRNCDFDCVRHNVGHHHRLCANSHKGGQKSANVVPRRRAELFTLPASLHRSSLSTIQQPRTGTGCPRCRISYGPRPQ